MTITHIVDIPEDLRNNLIVALVSLLAGAMIHKVYGKTARLRYSTQIDRLALAADDPIFGSVRVTRGTHGVRNLYMARVDIENTSSRDFENVRFKVYTANETFLLNERTFIPGEPYILEWSPEFKSLLAVVQGGTPTADQFNIYNHTREYRVPVLNRGQLLQFSYLCTRPNDDIQPDVFVSTRLKGAILKRQSNSMRILGVPLPIVQVRGFIIAILTVAACGLWVHSIWAAIGISMIVGLFAQALAVVEYRFERWVWNLIAG